MSKFQEGDMEMKRSLILIAVILAAMLLAACGGSAEPPPPPTSAGDIAAGKIKFEGTCISCHGPDAKGLPNLGKDLTVSVFLTDNSDEQMVAFLQKGRPASDPANTTGVDMPPRGGNPALTDTDLLNIIAYVRSLHE